jgi:hypothetical protein
MSNPSVYTYERAGETPLSVRLVPNDFGHLPGVTLAVGTLERVSPDLGRAGSAEAVLLLLRGLGQELRDLASWVDLVAVDVARQEEAPSSEPDGAEQ